MTLVIGAILLGYGIPEWADFVRNQRLQAAQTSLAASVAHARGYALKKQVSVVICPGDTSGCSGSNQWHHGWVAFEDNNRNRRKDRGERLVLVESAIPHDVHVFSSSHRNILRFTQMGFSPGSNASLWLCDSRGVDSGRSLIIANSGRIRLQNHTWRCH